MTNTAILSFWDSITIN